MSLSFASRPRGLPLVACMLAAFVCSFVQAAPVPVRVIDKETRELVPGFEYSVVVVGSDGASLGAWDDWRRAPSLGASVEFDAPDECRVSLSIRARGYVYSRRFTDYTLSPGSPREIVVELERGVTLRGVVTDKATGEPVVGAAVSPGVFRQPIRVPEDSLCVYTNVRGEFTLPGADLVYFVQHDLYIKHEGFVPRGVDGAGADDQDRFVAIALDPGLEVHGVVRDRRGLPIGDAEVRDPMTGKSARTDADGQFTVRGLDPRWASNGVSFWVQRTGYVKADVRIPFSETDAARIVMTELAQLHGRAIDEQGNPLRRFYAATGAGTAPADFQCVTKLVESEDGSFALPSDVGDAGTWLAVWADGYATLERVVSEAEAMAPIEAVVPRGAEVRGRVVGPKGPLGGSVTLRGVGLDQPMPRDQLRIVGGEPLGMYLADRRSDIAPDGTFVVKGLAPGVYTVHAASEVFTGRRFVIEVDDAARSIDLGEIHVHNVGVVHGVATFGGEPLAYRRGSLTHESLPLGEASPNDWYRGGGVAFQTDAHGRFEVRGVPTGTVRIGFSALEGCFLVTQAGAEVEIGPGEVREISVNESTISGSVCAKPGAKRIVTIDPVGVDGTCARISVSSTTPACVPTRIRLVHESGDELLLFAATSHEEPRVPRSIAASNLRPGRWTAFAETELGTVGRAEFVIDSAMAASVTIPLEIMDLRRP